MIRTIRRFLVLIITVPLLLAVAGAVLLRQGRVGFGSAFEIRTGLAQVLFTSARSYVYAARAGEKIVLFDTGTDPSGKGIDALLGSLYATRANVEDIFLSHGHGDHVAGVAIFPHARVHGGAGDVDLASRKVAPERPVPAILSFLAPAPIAEITDPLNGEADIDVAGGKKVHAIPLPGHTPGSYAYFFEGVLFVGDTLALDHGKLTVGPGFFTSDAEEQADSIKKLKAWGEKVKVEMVCTGHGGCSRTGEGAALLRNAGGRGHGAWSSLF